MIHLQTVARKPSFPAERQEFPFNVPVMQSLNEIRFTTPVTFLVGENGSGKSTLLESLAIGAGAVAVGSDEINRDQTLAPARQLSRYLQLSWTKRTQRGFFMRSEDFFGFARRIAAIRADLEAEKAAVDQEYKGRSAYARSLAKMAYSRELHDLQQRYGEGLDARSHGEAFLALFQSRFIPRGLYLMDEPEAPLSPLRQVGFLSLLKEMVAQDAQFIIATHSPILMAFPGATILNFDQSSIRAVRWDELEHVTVTRMFLNDPEAFMQHL